MKKTIAYKPRTTISFTWNNQKHFHNRLSPLIVKMHQLELERIRNFQKSHKNMGCKNTYDYKENNINPMP